MAKILLLDFETSPSLAFVWKFWQENVSPKQVKENSQILSAAWKWLGQDEVYYAEARKGSDRKVIRPVHAALEEADIVIAHNAKKFDLPVFNSRSVVNGFGPPAPYKVVDTLIEARKNFRFGSNSLEFLAQYLGCTPKQSHKKFPGFELWKECLAGNDEAWAELQAYNIQDVLTLEEVYLKLRPWMTRHPNIGVYSEETVPVCPRCGGNHIHYRGFYRTNISKFQRFVCRDCGSWGRLRTNEMPKEVMESLAVGAAD
jgi:hypothetical protein